MARNGSGTYSLPAGNPVTTGTTISSTWANNTLNDLGSALTASLAYDGQTIPVANLPMGGFVHTNVGNATLRTNYPSAGQVQDSALTYLSSIAGTNTITATAPVSMSAYATGQEFTFVAANSNTGGVTININSIGAKSITKNGTTALAVGDIIAGAIINVVYDGTQFQMVSPTPALTSLSGGTTGLVTYNSNATTVTISFASPAVFTVASAGLLPANTTQIELLTTGTLPAGVSTNQVYYVVNASGTTFNVSLTSGGSAINTTGAGSGTHSFAPLSNIGALTITGTLATANGGTGLNAFVAGTNYATPNAATTYTAQQTFSGSASTLAAKFANSAEVVTVNAGGASGTINYDLTTQSILYYTGNSSGVLTLNFRASSGTSLNTAMAVGDSVTGTLMITNSTATTVTAGSFVIGQTYTIVSVGTTSFTAIGASSNTVGVQFTATGVGSGTGTASYATYVLTVQVDGTTVTPKYQNGNVINTGDASAIDAFTYTIIKTASATFTVLASKTKFA